MLAPWLTTGPAGVMSETRYGKGKERACVVRQYGTRLMPTLRFLVVGRRLR